MRFSCTPEMRELMKIFEPYEDGCVLVKDAPKEAVAAYNKFCELFDNEYKKILNGFIKIEFDYLDNDLE